LSIVPYSVSVVETTLPRPAGQIPFAFAAYDVSM
jgi:hypothetical protein